MELERASGLRGVDVARSGLHDAAMKSIIALLAALTALLVGASLSAQTPAPKYVVGQVWEYKTRPQDAGSLLKIQRVETDGDRPVYHISIIGVHFRQPGPAGILPHLPVSDQTLDASVTRLSPTSPDFPTTTSVDEGIAEWRKAEGGVFTISVAKIVDVIEQSISGPPQP
jgi:hypothetical protein